MKSVNDISIVQIQKEVAATYLNEVSETLALHKNYSVEEYCFYLYLKTLQKNCAMLSGMIKRYDLSPIDKNYESLSEGRRKLVDPVIVTDRIRLQVCRITVEDLHHRIPFVQIII